MVAVYAALLMLAATLVILMVISELPEGPSLADPIKAEPIPYRGRHWASPE